MGRDLKDYLPELELLDITLGSGKKIYLGGTGASIEGDGTTVTITGTFALGPIDIAAGTQTVANPMLDATATWNAAGPSILPGKACPSKNSWTGARFSL